MNGMAAEIRPTIAGCPRVWRASLETTRQSLALIAGLEAVSRSVDKIVDGIGMVSIQTNMLAVSGSVEAARAGDFGKGFAVVSKDIRSLARDSGENAGAYQGYGSGDPGPDRCRSPRAGADHSGGRS